MFDWLKDPSIVLKVATWVGAACTLGIAGAAAYAFPHPMARLAALALWCAVSAGICITLFVPARSLFASRRGNLATLPRA